METMPTFRSLVGPKVFGTFREVVRTELLSKGLSTQSYPLAEFHRTLQKKS